MSRITMEFTCPTCGQVFEKSFFRRNTREAASFREWAEANITTTTECPACWRAGMTENSAETAEKLGLPEITGKSARQIAYAADLRGRYIARHRDFIDGCLRRLEEVKTDEFRETAREAGWDDAEIRRAICALTTEAAYVICTTGDARQLIDALK